MTNFKEITDLKESAKLSEEVNTQLDLHLEMGMRERHGKVVIWWNLPDKWVMCEETYVNIYDYNGKWIKAWKITPSHVGEIQTEFDWGTGWSANLYAYPPESYEIQIMRTDKITLES